MARTITMITFYSTLRLTGGYAAIPAGADGGNDMTEVAVRCGYEGCWDRNTAERIHATIPDTI